MTIRISTALRNAQAQGYGLGELLRDCVMYLYGVNQAASADDEPAAAPLAAVTVDAATYVPAIPATATLTLAAMAGTIDTLTLGGGAHNYLGGAVTIDEADLPGSLAAVAAAINATCSPIALVAVSDGVDTVTLSAPNWLGAGANGLTIATTQTGAQVTINGGSSSAIGGAGATAGVNATAGLNFLFPAVGGVLSKNADTWQGYADARGLLRSFRMVAGGSAPTGPGASNLRFDGSVGVSGADLDVDLVVVGEYYKITVNDFSVTIPAE
jgi:hypothetical protein